MTIVRHVLALALALTMGSASAQSRSIQLAELVDVPVAMASSKALTVDQVRNAIIAATLAGEWDAEVMSPSVLRVSAVRDLDTRVALLVSFTATTYSIRYESSENLRYSDIGEIRQTGPISAADHTKEWRATRAARQPEFRYAVDKLPALIHPTYEQYLYELSAAIRRQLRWSVL